MVEGWETGRQSEPAFMAPWLLKLAHRVSWEAADERDLQYKWGYSENKPINYRPGDIDHRGYNGYIYPSIYLSIYLSTYQTIYV